MDLKRSYEKNIDMKVTNLVKSPGGIQYEVFISSPKWKESPICQQEPWNSSLYLWDCEYEEKAAKTRGASMDAITNAVELKLSDPVLSPGGIQYEVFIESPKGKKLKKSPVLQRLSCDSYFSTPVKHAHDIKNELKAAEKRRASVQAQKLSFALKQVNRIDEVKQRKEERENAFKQNAKHNAERKMKRFMKKHETIAKSSQKVSDRFQQVKIIQSKSNSPENSNIIKTRSQMMKLVMEIEEPSHRIFLGSMKEIRSGITKTEDKRLQKQFQEHKGKIYKSQDAASKARNIKMQEVAKIVKERKPR